MNKKPRKTALLIRCTTEEAERIRHAAMLERRTITGYILNAVMSRIAAKANHKAAANGE